MQLTNAMIVTNNSKILYTSSQPKPNTTKNNKEQHFSETTKAHPAVVIYSCNLQFKLKDQEFKKFKKSKLSRHHKAIATCNFELLL